MSNRPTVFLLHGSWGNPNNIWFPWLRQELTSRQFQVISPKFPTPFGQNLDRWQQAFAPYRAQLSPETIVVAHSVAVPFCLNLLSTLSGPVRGCVFVSGFAAPIRLGGRGITSFLTPFDWARIRSAAQHFTLFNSDNDLIVPARRGRELAEQVNGEFHLIHGAGHFTPWNGYRQFPELRDSILRMAGQRPA